MIKMQDVVQKANNSNKIQSNAIRFSAFIGFKALMALDECKTTIREIYPKNIYNKLLKYKNLYLGKRCFIVATGPSLTVSDLGLIKNEISFSMNSIVKRYNEIDYRPTFYAIQDLRVYEELYDFIYKEYNRKDNVFISDRIRRNEKTCDSWNVFQHNIAYHAYDRWFNEKFYSKFSDDIYKRIYDGYSITISIIQIAAYMGFKEIYLLGADCNFNTKGSLHFADYKAGEVDPTLNTATERNISGYESAKLYCDQHGIKIYNATRGGRLEVFPRVNLDDVIKYHL